MIEPSSGTVEKPATGGAASVAACWSCKGPVGAVELFCPVCQAVQPPGQKDHFNRLGLEAGFDIDADSLDRLYFDLQRRLHPDRFATKTPREKALSQSQATCLNEAYETLKEPLRRADYLVHLRGSGVLREGCYQINDPVILMEAMELRESLADARTEEEVNRIASETEADIKDCLIGLSAAFRGDDLDGACGLTTRLKYLTKLADEVRIHRATLAGS